MHYIFMPIIIIPAGSALLPTRDIIIIAVTASVALAVIVIIVIVITIPVVIYGKKQLVAVI